MCSVLRPHEHSDIQREGLWDSVTQLLKIVKEEAASVGPENVIVAGISQGCATAIYTLLASSLRFGGFTGLCGWLSLADGIMKLMNIPGRAKEVLEHLYYFSTPQMTKLCLQRTAKVLQHT
jgi:lysophospholipase-2